MENISEYWKEQIAKIQSEMESKPFSNFQQWETIRSNMVVLWSNKTDAELGDIELNYPLIETPEIGNPSRVNVNGKLLSANTIHMLYHWMQWGDLKRLKSILEYGGGFGEMYRLARTLGFEGKYVIFDLPIITAIQISYIKELDLLDDCECISDINDLPRMVDLTVSMSALSEMPYEYRGQLTERTVTNGFLLSYSDDLGYTNSEWFRDMASQHPEMCFDFRDHPYRKLKYLIGRANAGIRLSGRIRPSIDVDSRDDGESGNNVSGMRKGDAPRSSDNKSKLERSSSKSGGTSTRDSEPYKKRGTQPGSTLGNQGEGK